MANEVFLHKRVVQVFRMGTDELSVAVASAEISWHTGFTSKNSTSDRVLLPLLHLHPH
jgi:hypothetical protein